MREYHRLIWQVIWNEVMATAFDLLILSLFSEFNHSSSIEGGQPYRKKSSDFHNTLVAY
ncbi:hypothetical protein ACERII_22195 [Evansella sp. AB-rgal1]|uniref:hypothetical protein n=1 Tax=Evansella sp. AB-rgal1 TaxID=3242696 RepID=UPI00359D8216